MTLLLSSQIFESSFRLFDDIDEGRASSMRMMTIMAILPSLTVCQSLLMLLLFVERLDLLLLAFPKSTTPTFRDILSNRTIHLMVVYSNGDVDDGANLLDSNNGNDANSFDIDDADSFNCGNDNGSDSGASANVDSIVRSVTKSSFRKFDDDDDGANVDADD